MILEVVNLTKRFGSLVAVDDVSFSIDKGEIVGFVGANGAGKTTTISALLGFIGATKGDVKLFGQAVSSTKAYKTHGKIGYAAGDMALPARITGRQYLEFVRSQFADVADERLNDLCRRFQPQLDKKISTLSRGNHQKIALVAAFLPNPELVILDEPTSGLDPIMQEAFLELVQLEQQQGTTIFMSSHYLNEVADVCSRVILMRSGQIIKDVASEELLKGSGKTVRVVVGHAMTRVPKGAEKILRHKDKHGNTIIDFSWKQSPLALQGWIAGLKQLKDIEITEYNLEDAFSGLYDTKDQEETS